MSGGFLGQLAASEASGPNSNSQASTQTNQADMLAAILGNIKGEDTTSTTPEDELNSLFTPTDKDHKDEVFDPSTLFAELDSAKVQEGISKMNFADGVLTPELSEAIIGGGQEGLAAMIQIMNAIAQKAVHTNFTVGTGLIQHGFSKAQPSWQQTTSTSLRDNNITDTIKAASPIFSSTIGAPLVEKLHKAIVAKQPNASKEEVTRIASIAVKSLLGDSYQEVKKDETKPKEAPQTEEFWNDFFSKG